MHPSKILFKNIYLGLFLVSLFSGKTAFSQAYRNKMGIDFSKHNLMYQEPKDSIFNGNFMDYVSYFDSEFIAHLSYNLAQNNYEIDQPGTTQNVSYSDCFIDFTFDEPATNKKVKSVNSKDSVYLGMITTRIICSVDNNPNKIFYCTNSTKMSFSIFEINPGQIPANNNSEDSLYRPYYFKPNLLDSSETKLLAKRLAKSTSIKMDSIETAKYKLNPQKNVSTATSENNSQDPINFGPILFKIALIIITLIIIAH